MALLHVENLRVDIPMGNSPTPDDTLHAVRGLNFEVERGEMLCIVGESGCGKSLTSLALMDLLPRKAKRTASRLTLDGIDMLGQSERHMCDLRGNRLAMIFQEPMTSAEPGLQHWRSTQREVLTRHRKVSRKEALVRAGRMLEKSRHQQCHRALAAVSASTVWRLAPAGDHCHGVDVRTGPDHRR